MTGQLKLTDDTIIDIH